MTMATMQLAGREFELRPLTLGQLRLLFDALGDLSGKSGGALVESAAKIIHAGLARSHPELTLEAVLDMETSLDEANDAVAAILRMAGLAPAGEARPVAIAETGSPGSTAPSPPAADTRSPSSTR